MILRIGGYVMKINPLKSQLLGLIVSMLTGVEVAYVSWWFFAKELYYPQPFIGRVIGISLGCIVTFNVLMRHQRDVPTNHEGTIFLLGKRTEIKCSEGRHWVPLLCEIRTLSLGKSELALMTAKEVVIPKEMSNLVRVVAIVVAIFMGINAAAPITRGRKMPETHRTALVVPECDITRATHLYTLHVRADGSTKVISVPNGKNVCFGTSFWMNLSRLGYRTSDGVGSERPYTCTKEEVVSNTCHERIGNTFQFTPQKGVHLPRYWFMGT